MTKSEAEKLASEYFGQLPVARQDDLVIEPDKTRTVNFGWICFYNTKEFVETLKFEFPAKWFPVQAFFNAVSDDDFPRMVKDLVGHIGWHVDVCHCEFSEGLEPDEEPFEGVKFSLYQDEVVLSQGEFVSVLTKVCAAQKRRLPKQARVLDAALLELDLD